MSESREPGQAAHAILLRPPAGDPSYRGDEFMRPLGERGKEAARRAAADIYGKGHHPGPLLVAPVLVARQTAEILMDELHVAADDIHYADLLYEASADLMHALLRVRAEAYTLPTLIADNPGITGLARFLAGNANAPAMQPGEWRYLDWRPY